MVFSSDSDLSQVQVYGDVPSLQTIKSHLALTNAFFLLLLEDHALTSVPAFGKVSILRATAAKSARPW